MDGRALAGELRCGSPGTGVFYIAEPLADLADDALGLRWRRASKPFDPGRLARFTCKMVPPCSDLLRRVRGLDVPR